MVPLDLIKEAGNAVRAGEISYDEAEEILRLEAERVDADELSGYPS